MVLLLSFGCMQQASDGNEQTGLIHSSSQEISQTGQSDRLKELKKQAKKIQRETALINAQAKLTVLVSSLEDGTCKEDYTYTLESGREFRVGYRYELDSIVYRTLLLKIDKSALENKEIIGIVQDIEIERNQHMSPSECPCFCCPTWLQGNSKFDNRPKNVVYNQAENLRVVISQTLHKEELKRNNIDVSELELSAAGSYQNGSVLDHVELMSQNIDR